MGLPALRDITAQLHPVSTIEKWSVVAIPLMTMSAYFLFAAIGWYWAAFMSVFYLSFVTYGSCCHDLVHCNIGLTRKASSIWLSVIELLMMRSGTTYRVTHLNHHLRYPDFAADPEGRASYFSIWRTFAEGPVFHLKLILWTLKHAQEHDRFWVKVEIAAILIFYTLGIAIYNSFPSLLIYQLAVTMGAWVIPFITSYLVHVPNKTEAIRQTKIFRGMFFRLIALDHLYHLEHHLYPAIPHCRWKDLALILNPYFERENLTAIRIECADSKNFDLN
jgi:beta-carotene hydroxylase